MEFMTNINWDFLAQRKKAYIFSGVLILAGIIALIINGGPHYNIDFKGGEVIEVGFGERVDVAQVRSIVDKLGVRDAEIQLTEEGKVALFRVPADIVLDSGVDFSETLLDELRLTYGENKVDLRRQESVGPKVSGELRKQAIWATIFALVGILIYITIRFKFRFGVAAVIALFHDVFITVGLLTIFGREISLPVVAALLTIVGYSINDTIVISDRIRENIRILYREKFENLVNRSLNQSFTRTIITSLTTIVVLLSIFFFGGPVIRDFSLALIIGAIIGTYSSIYIVSPIVIAWENASPKKVGGKK
jgi:preprotein translocase subunit SecF